ncbi:calcium-binding protein NCS-1-like [Haliotis rufescens]|uniref:calcium-binding protein NCS-1-like n=1 Tax=Haliotis rufescens TaxID=6454 RepID=UPI00201EFF1C|nr:calcium-binding protein NCS-1-like [Haliotis rufescens]
MMFSSMFVFLALCCITYSDLLDETEKQLYGQLDLDKDHEVTLPEMDSYFEKFDTDGDGIITLKYLITQLALDWATAKKQISVFDKNKDGVITKVDVKLIFDLLDTNKNGKVTLQEFQDKYVEVLTAGVNIIGK